MFLDLFGDRSARRPQTMHTGIMFADLSGIHSKPLSESCQPEKWSWSYLAVALRLHQTVPTPKNVPGPIRGSLRSLATDDAYPNNVRRPIGNSLQAPG